MTRNERSDSFYNVRHTVLNDAQIRGLPQTGIQVVPAQGAGKIILPLWATFVSHFSAGAYAGIDSFGAVCLYWTVKSGGDSFCNIYDSNGSLFSFAGDQFFPASLGTSNDGNGFNFPPGDETSKFANKPLMVGFHNGTNDPVLTGGNVANRMVVTIAYTVLGTV